MYATGLDLPAVAGARLARRPVALKVPGDRAWERGRRLGLTQVGFDAFQHDVGGPARLRAMRAVRNWAVRHASVVVVPSHYLAGVAEAWTRRSHARDRGAERGPAAGARRPRLPPRPGRCRGDGSRAPTRLRRTPRVPQAGRPAPRRARGLRPVRRPSRSSVKVRSAAPSKPTRRGSGSGRGCDSRASSDHDEVMRAPWPAPHALVSASTYEGLPHVVIEALVCGTPVVTAPAGGVVEVIVDDVNGILVDPRRPGRLRRRLRQAANRPRPPSAPGRGRARERGAVGLRPVRDADRRPPLLDLHPATSRRVPRAGSRCVAAGRRPTPQARPSTPAISASSPSARDRRACAPSPASGPCSCPASPSRVAGAALYYARRARAGGGGRRRTEPAAVGQAAWWSARAPTRDSGAVVARRSSPAASVPWSRSSCTVTGARRLACTEAAARRLVAPAADRVASLGPAAGRPRAGGERRPGGPGPAAGLRRPDRPPRHLQRVRRVLRHAPRAAARATGGRLRRGPRALQGGRRAPRRLAAVVGAECRTAELVMVGAGTLRDELHRRVAAEAIPSVRTLDPMPQAELVRSARPRDLPGAARPGPRASRGSWSRRWPGGGRWWRPTWAGWPSWSTTPPAGWCRRRTSWPWPTPWSRCWPTGPGPGRWAWPPGTGPRRRQPAAEYEAGIARLAAGPARRPAGRPEPAERPDRPSRAGRERGPHLVFVTQVVDPADPVLGFSVSLARALAARSASLLVIANEVRQVPADLAAEVRSLGKEHGRGRMAKGARYQRILADACRRAPAGHPPGPHVPALPDPGGADRAGVAAGRVGPLVHPPAGQPRPRAGPSGWPTSSSPPSPARTRARRPRSGPSATRSTPTSSRRPHAGAGRAVAAGRHRPDIGREALSGDRPGRGPGPGGRASTSAAHRGPVVQRRRAGPPRPSWRPWWGGCSADGAMTGSSRRHPRRRPRPARRRPRPGQRGTGSADKVVFEAMAGGRPAFVSSPVFAYLVGGRRPPPAPSRR